VASVLLKIPSGLFGRLGTVFLASSRATTEGVKESNPRFKLNVSVARVKQDRQPHLADPMDADCSSSLLLTLFTL
jgi:hypothetical protein